MEKQKYISRVEQKGRITFWVRLKYESSAHAHKKQKSFTENQYGGEEQAKLAAIKWRDEQMANDPDYYGPMRCSKKHHNNTSGTTGVHRQERERPLQEGGVSKYWCWVAAWREGNARHNRTKSFRFYPSIEGSEEQAKAEAIAFRKTVELTNYRIDTNQPTIEMSEEMENVIDKLTHKMQAKAIFKKMTLEQIAHMMEAAVEVREIKVREAQELQLMVNKQSGAIEEARRILAEAGLALDDDALTADAKAAAKAVQRAKRRSYTVKQDKYMVTDKKGNVRLWSGSGHMPVQIKEIMTKAPKKDRITKESFLKGHDFKWQHTFSDLIKCNVAA